jgi:hypothetical protein
MLTFAELKPRLQKVGPHLTKEEAAELIYWPRGRRGRPRRRAQEWREQSSNGKITEPDNSPGVEQFYKDASALAAELLALLYDSVQVATNLPEALKAQIPH